MKIRSIRRLLAAVALLAVPFSLTQFVPANALTRQVVAAPDKPLDESSVGIQMFMYNWNSIASECTNYMGPAGIDWVQVSPPQESVVGSQWWVHYQPVSYKIESSLGTRAQFAAMVNACNAAGVMVIVDAVINHMANTSGTGFAGTDFSKYTYPGLYNLDNFHAGLGIHDPNYCGDQIQNYDSLWETTHCELGGLPDLATEQTAVREKIAGYLNDLISLGVSGFRVDAAKHFGSDDLHAVVNMLDSVNGHAPYIMSEVIGDATVNQPFVDWGSKVWAWSMPNMMQQTMGFGNMSWAKSIGWTNDYNGSANTIMMVSNHDTEHHGPSSLDYSLTGLYQLAHIYMLSIPYGIPELYTGYTFTSEDSGPPSYSNGYVKNATCPTVSYKPTNIVKDGIYTCVERWRAIQGMIKWRDAAGTAPMTHAVYTRYTGGSKLVSYNRGTNWLAMNPTSVVKKNNRVRTWLPKGTYCDVISGGRGAAKANHTCLSTTIVVDAKGYATVTVPAQSAIAFGAFTKIK